MRLRARVLKVTGATRQYRAHAEADDLVKGTELPRPAAVELRTEGGGCFLLHLDEDGECFADTWHETLEDAKEQARFEFEIEEGDWEVIGPAGQT